jgi:cytochrome c5
MKQRSKTMKLGAGLVLLAGVAVSGCGQEAGETAAVEQPLSEELAFGKTVWEANCQVCHGPGLAGAPRLGDAGAWAKRVAKGMDTLVAHATYGYAGPSGHEMPARGGNPTLDDNEIAVAVAYMVFQSK